jgi:4-carboxymuconolactone decarboxylase
MTPQQAVEEFKRLRGVEPFGPFVDLLASPELMTRVSALGEYLRYRSALPPRLSELAILVTASHWRQHVEWDIHSPIALEAGIPQQIIDAIWNQQPPHALDADAQAVYDICIELHQQRTLSKATRDRAEAVLGEQAVVDAIAICGYYALLAMVLNSRR